MSEGRTKCHFEFSSQEIGRSTAIAPVLAYWVHQRLRCSIQRGAVTESAREPAREEIMGVTSAA